MMMMMMMMMISYHHHISPQQTVCNCICNWISADLLDKICMNLTKILNLLTITHSSRSKIEIDRPTNYVLRLRGILAWPIASWF